MRFAKCVMVLSAAFPFVGGGCQRSHTEATPLAASNPKDAAVPPETHAPEALVGEWLGPLDDALGRAAGSVAMAVGARERRPMVVAVHGAESRPDWMCSAIRASVGPYPFVVCPHPVARRDTLASWRSAEQVRLEVARSVASAKERFGPWLDVDDALYIGHSQGGMLAPEALDHREAVRFRYAIFFEGLPSNGSVAKRQLLSAKVERALFFSGQTGWASAHLQFAKSFLGTDLTARHVQETTGHFFGATIYARLRSELPWVVSGSLRWEPALLAL